MTGSDEVAAKEVKLVDEMMKPGDQE